MNRRRWIWGFALAVVACGVGIFVLDRVLEVAFRAPIDGYLRARALAMMEAKEADGLDVGIREINLHLFLRRLDLHGLSIRYIRQDGERQRQLEADAPAVTLSGVDLSDMIWHRRFRLSGVRVQSPVVRHRDEGPADTLTPPVARESDTLPVTIPPPDSLLFLALSRWLPDEIRHGRIEDLRVENATAVSVVRRGKSQNTDSTSGLSVRLRGLALDSARHRVYQGGALEVAYFSHATPGGDDSLIIHGVSLTVNANDTAFTVAEIRTGPERGGHAFRAAGIRRSHALRMLTVDTLVYGPLASDSNFFRQAAPRSTRIRAVGIGVKILGLTEENIRRRRITAGGIWIGSADLDVMADRRVDGPPHSGRRRLWPTRLAALDWVVGADSVVLGQGRIRYTELYRGALAGSISFSNIHARILNASNDSVARQRPVVINAEAKLYGKGRLQATIAVPVREGPFRADVEGQMGAMPIALFNEFLDPSSGMQVTGGELHEASFKFRVMDGRARGQFRAAWEGLGLRKVNKKTGGQSLGDRLVSIAANTMTQSSNLPDSNDTKPTAPIRYRVLPSDTFWQLLWRSLRSGMLKAVKE